MDEQTSVIRIKASAVLRAVTFCAKNDVRFYLHGVHISSNAGGGATAAASDGHTLGAFIDASGVAQRSAILPITKAQAPLLRRGQWVVMDSNGVITIVGLNKEPIWISPAPEIQAEYPDFAAIIGTKSSWAEGLSGCYNPALLARIEAAAKGGITGARFFHKKNAPGKRALLVTLDSLGFILVMPMHDCGPETALNVIPSNLFTAEQEEGIPA